jgi:hypothetical protein
MQLNRAYEIKGWMSEELIHGAGNFKKSYFIAEGFQYSDFLRATTSLNVINGVGISVKPNSRDYSIKIFSTKAVQINSKVIANYFDVPQADILISKIGDIDLRDRTEKNRPSSPGDSIGHPRITAGTFGAVVKDHSDSYYILSNNHVLANLNDCSIGDPILQPGQTDKGRNPRDVIASLSAYVPIDFLGINQIDAAIAKPVKNPDIVAHIPNIGRVSGITNPRIGMKVVKYGRTTGYTTGMITSRNDDIKVNLGGKLVEFEDQFEIQGVRHLGKQTKFSAGGDSGSLIVEYETNLAVGLLFAGNELGVTFANPINKVLDSFDVSLV